MYRPIAAALSCVVVLLCASAGSAQVIYEQTRSQHVAGNGAIYYYGGVNPNVHAMVRLAHGCNPAYGTNLHRFDGGNSFNQPSPMQDRTPVFTDRIPYQDARWFGYTAADAENEARANAARYYRKADQLETAMVLPDGTRIVPAHAPVMMPTPAPVYVPAPRPTTRGGQVIIIPKHLLDRSLKSLEKKGPEKVAAAR